MENYYLNDNKIASAVNIKITYIEINYKRWIYLPIAVLPLYKLMHEWLHYMEWVCLNQK